MMLNLRGLTSGVDSVSHPGFVQQSGPGAYTGPFTKADFDALDAYVSAEVAAMRALGYNASAQTHHPSVMGGEGPADPDYPSAHEGAYYEWIITVDPVKAPGYVREETVASYRSYSGGDPAKAAQGAINDAGTPAYVYTPPAETSTPAGSQSSSAPTPASVVTPSTSQTPATPSVVDSILNSVGVSNLVSAGTLSSIPTWAWLAGGAAALYFFMGRGK